MTDPCPNCPIGAFCRTPTCGRLQKPSTEQLYHVPDQKVEIPVWLREMSVQMNEQPNRSTSHPFWQVRCKRFIPTLEGYNESHFEIIHEEDGVVWNSNEEIRKFGHYLLEMFPEFAEEFIKSTPDYDEADDTGLEYRLEVLDYFDFTYDELPSGLTKVPVQEVEEIVSTHLTQADAEWFIKRKQHDYPPLYTYVESAYWSPQLKKLQDWIKGLTKGV